MLKYFEIMTFIFLHFCMLYLHKTYCQDYSVIEQDTPFRSGKINLLWNKAKRMLNNNDLLKLYGDFSIQDHLEMEYKKDMQNIENDYGDREAFIRQKLLSILNQYKIEHIYPYDDISVKPLSSLKKIKARISKNERLIKLWDKIENGEFNEQELKQLEKEFMHYLDKLDEFNLLQKELENLREHSVNMIQKHKHDPNNIHEEVKNKNNILKQKHISIKEKFKQLQDLIGSKSNNVNNESTNEYSSTNLDSEDWQDPRISELWSLADQSNLTDMEKQAFKEELGHFGRKIAKHHFYLKEAANLKPKTHHQDFENIYNDMEKKINSQAKKVKKWYIELKSRLTNRIEHSDL